MYQNCSNLMCRTYPMFMEAFGCIITAPKAQVNILFPAKTLNLGLFYLINMWKYAMFCVICLIRLSLSSFRTWWNVRKNKEFINNKSTTTVLAVAHFIHTHKHCLKLAENKSLWWWGTSYHQSINGSIGGLQSQ